MQWMVLSAPPDPHHFANSRAVSVRIHQMVLFCSYTFSPTQQLELYNLREAET